MPACPAVGRRSMGSIYALARGDFVVVIGSNGAGKSTLLNTIAGAISPDGGSIVLDGVDITRMAAHRRAGLITRVFQDPIVGTAAAMTIEENLALAEQRGKARGLAFELNSRKRDDYQGAAFAARARPGKPSGHAGRALSGGQRQSLSLIMAVLPGTAASG